MDASFRYNWMKKTVLGNNIPSNSTIYDH